jgi:hypothetical protein
MAGLSALQITQPPISPPPLHAGEPPAGRVKCGHDEKPGNIGAGQAKAQPCRWGRLDAEATQLGASSTARTSAIVRWRMSFWS